MHSRQAAEATCGLWMGAGPKTLRATTPPLAYSTTDKCAPVWCRNAHSRLIDSVLIDALRIANECLRLTLTDHLPIFSGIQPAELCRLWATLSLTKHGTLDPDHILNGPLVGSPDVHQEKLKSRRSLVPAARKLLSDLSKLGIRSAQWTKYKWSTECFKSTSMPYVFISRASARPFE